MVEDPYDNGSIALPTACRMLCHGRQPYLALNIAARRLTCPLKSPEIFAVAAEKAEAGVVIAFGIRWLRNEIWTGSFG